MLKENSKLKDLKNIRKGLIKESNDFKNSLLNKIWEDLNFDFRFRFNDLYSVAMFNLSKFRLKLLMILWN